MKNKYESPLNLRYASDEMSYLFSADYKFSTWRKLWIALAETERELGLDITDEQIAQMKEHIYDINYAEAEAREKEVRHDVMSHMYAYGLQVRLQNLSYTSGATSCYVGANTDIIIMTEAMKLVKKRLINVINELSKFAMEYRSMPTLGFTHFQAAQTTTVGKRATLWIQDLLMDLEDLDHQISKAKLLGSKGTTERRRASWSFLKATMKNAESLTEELQRKWDLKIILKFPVRHIPESLILRYLTCFRELLRAPISSAMI